VPLAMKAKDIKTIQGRPAVMNRYYAYTYLAMFWALKYVFPFILIAFIPIFIVLKKWLFLIIVFTILVLDIVILNLLKRPKKIASKEIDDRYVQKSIESDFLLIVSLKGIKKAAVKKSFNKQDWSCAWINTLMQEAGSFAVLDLEKVDKKQVMSRSVIILSKSATEAVSEGLIKTLDIFVKKGGMLILEQPTNKLSRLFGVTFDSKQINPKKITYLDQSYKEYEIIKNLPLYTFLNKILHKEKNIKTLLAFDDLPAILKKKQGKGMVLTLCFDFGLQLTAVQQGKPLNNYIVKSKTGLKDLCGSEDLILDKSLENNKYPLADILEKFIFEILMKHRPIPRLWYFKDNYSGAVIMTHDEDYFGDRIKYMIDYEKAINATSTFFIAPSDKISKKIVSLLLENSEIGIHWDRMKYFLFYLFNNAISDERHLSNQINLFRSKYKKDIISNRNHFLKWDNHYTNTLRLLYKNNIKIDSSYGHTNGKGYFFGTGFAFYPLDTNGLVIPILEIPLQIQDIRAGANIQYIKDLIGRNNKEYHGLLVFLFHPQKSMPGSRAGKVWMETYKLADYYGQWLTNFQEFYDFFNKRQNSVIKSKFANDRLSILVNSTDQAIMVPFKYNSKKIKTIKIDRSQIKHKKLVNIINFKYCLIKMAKGKHLLQVFYE